MYDPQTLLRIPRRGLEAALLIALLCAGCGRKGEVSGTVTYQGKPVTIGTVTFVDANTNQALGSSTISGGKYRINKVPVGPVKILVTTPPPQTNAGKRLPSSSIMDKMVQRKAKSKGLASPPESGGPPAPPVAVPAKYGNPEQSGLTYTVEPGAQQHDIDLK